MVQRINTSTEAQERVLLRAFEKNPMCQLNKYQATRLYGIDSLSQRISDLKQKGHRFNTVYRHAVDLFGIRRPRVAHHQWLGFFPETGTTVTQ